MLRKKVQQITRMTCTLWKMKYHDYIIKSQVAAKSEQCGCENAFQLKSYLSKVWKSL